MGETFDRSYTWVGDRFVVSGLLTSGVDNDESVRDVYQVAEYVPAGSQQEESWLLLPPSTVGFWDPRWVFHDGVLLNPSQEAVAQHNADWPSPGGQLDLATGDWTGEQLIVWGGPAADYQANLNSGLAWTPPPPR